jgi:hypothetical protein
MQKSFRLSQPAANRRYRRKFSLNANMSFVGLMKEIAVKKLCGGMRKTSFPNSSLKAVFISSIINGVSLPELA